MHHWRVKPHCNSKIFESWNTLVTVWTWCRWMSHRGPVTQNRFSWDFLIVMSNASLPVSYPGANFLQEAARITAIHLTIIVIGSARLPFLTSNHLCSARLHPIGGVILVLHCMEIIMAQTDRWVHKLNAKDLVWISHTLNLTHWGWDKWPPSTRRHFQMHFLEWKWINFH